MTVSLHRFFYKISYASRLVQQYYICVLRVTTYRSTKCLVCGNHIASLKPANQSSVITKIIKIGVFLLKGLLPIVKLLALTFTGIAIPLVYFTCKQAFKETNTLPWTTASVRTVCLLFLFNPTSSGIQDYCRYCIAERQYQTRQCLGMLKGNVLATHPASCVGTNSFCNRSRWVVSIRSRPLWREKKTPNDDRPIKS
jgi:hypothetical protein